MKNCQKWVSYILTVITIIFSQYNSVYAGSLEFFEDFESYDISSFPSKWSTVRNLQWNNHSLPCMNGSIPAEWKVINYNGNKVVSIALNGNSCVMEIVPKDFMLRDASNYELEMDMWFPTNVFKDRHIAYKYLTGNQWYGIKFIQPYQQEFYKVNLAEYPHLGLSHFSTGIQPNIKYRMKVRIIDNQISFYINDSLIHQVDDKEPILQYGTIALQASLSHLGPHITYFDNIKVTDLSPKPLFTHFSQYDQQWANDTYDHASAWTSFPTIKNWGCALTSAAMVLNHHGFTKGPSGQSTNPQTLNQYLTQVPGGYTPNGKIVWSAVTKYAQESKQNNQVDTETKLLEFSYPTFSENIAIADIESNNPPIIKINMEPDRAGYHFLVGSAKTNDNQIIINDPIQLTGEQKTIQDVYPENAPVSLARFIPSNTDLSYLWFETTPTTEVLLANDKESLIDAIYNDTGSILDPETDQVSPPSNLVGYQKPAAGKYFLSLDSDVDGIVPLFYGLYGQNADSTSGTISLFVDNESQRNIIIDYDKTIINQSQLMVLSTHKTLYNLIRYLSNEGKIPNKLSRHFTHLVDQSQKVSSANGYGHGQTAILYALIQQISNAYGEQKISKDTTDMLIQEITWLLSSIDDIKE